MVARGDLGVEMALEKVPFIQKSIIERARQHGKFVITATQMLESMIENPYPTRAEVSDIANAIYDGTDAVMLSGETSAGKYPVEAARMMAKIALEAEASLKVQGYKDPPRREQTPTYQETMADMTYRCARMQGATGIVVFTASGSSARLVSKYRPPVPIFAFTGSEAVARQLSIIYGVRAIVVPDPVSTDAMVLLIDQTLLGEGLVKLRDNVVFMAGQPIGRPGTTNFVKLHRMGRHLVRSALGIILLCVAAYGQQLDDRIRKETEAIKPNLVQMRRDFARHPELSNREEWTGKYIAEQLRKLGFTDIRAGVARHGVVATLKGDKPGPGSCLARRHGWITHPGHRR